MVYDCKLQNYKDDLSVLVASLKACAKHKDLQNGSKLHADIVQRGLLGKDAYLDSSLVNMYAKCGALAQAREVLEELPSRDVVSWTALIAGYAQYGYGDEALECFQLMKRDNISPNASTFVCILKACSSIRAAIKGQEIHAEIISAGLLQRNMFVGNMLVDMYAKCSLIAEAELVFDELSVRDVVCWTSLISGATQCGQDEEAILYFEHMHHEGLFPDMITLVCILKACGNLGAIDKGQEIHSQIVEERWVREDIMISNALVDMYARCGALAEAREVFDELAFRDINSWNALISGYVQYKHDKEALDCFEWMRGQGISPNAATFSCILKSCGSIGTVEKGRKLHAEIAKEGLLDRDIGVGTALMDMYAKCGALSLAKEAFDRLSVPNIVSWTALISGFVQHGHNEAALNQFEQMQSRGLSPNEVTLSGILKACGIIGAIEKGQQVHYQIAKQGLLGKDVVIGTGLIDMYGKCGALHRAHEVLDELVVRNVVSWTVLLAGYAQHGCNEESLNCFEQMQQEGLLPNAVTIVCGLKACGSIGSSHKGQKIHTHIVHERLLEKNVVVGNALVDMYIKSGEHERAQSVFDGLPNHDAASWNALIAGYSQLGDVDITLSLFLNMIAEGVEPDLATFTLLFNSCSHTGLVRMGLIYFEVLRMVYGIDPTIEHHVCIADLLGRSGLLDKVLAMIKSMPFLANYTLWHSLLNACQMWANVKVGKVAFEHVLQLDPDDVAAYVCMGNIYIATGMQEEADMLEEYGNML